MEKQNQSELELFQGLAESETNVTAGQAVKSGDVVAVLEAMKMENEIMVSHDATIAQVLVSVSSKVDTGTPLIVLG